MQKRERGQRKRDSSKPRSATATRIEQDLLTVLTLGLLEAIKPGMPAPQPNSQTDIFAPSPPSVSSLLVLISRPGIEDVAIRSASSREAFQTWWAKRACEEQGKVAKAGKSLIESVTISLIEESAHWDEEVWVVSPPPCTAPSSSSRLNEITKLPLPFLSLSPSLIAYSNSSWYYRVYSH